MKVRPVSLLELTLAAALVTAVNLSLLIWTVQQRGPADWAQRLETLPTDVTPLEPALQGHAP